MSNIAKRNLELIQIFFISFLFSLFIFVPFVLIFRQPAQLKPDFINRLRPWIRGGVIATWDVRNYLIGIFIFSTSPFLFLWLAKYKKKLIAFIDRGRKLSFFLSSLLLIALVFAISNLFSRFPLPSKLEIIQALGKKRGVELVHNLPYLGLSLVLLLMIYLIQKINLIKKLRLIFPFFKIKTKPSLTKNFLFFILIVVLIFNPRYKFSYEKILNYGGEAVHQFHHVNFYLGPINEVLQGKTLLVDAYSQYGLLATYIPAFIFKLTTISYTNFVLYNMLLSVAYSFLFFLFLQKLTKNYLWSAFFTLAYIKLVFFRASLPYEAYVLPSTTPLRYFFDIVVALFVFKLFSQKPNFKKSLLTSFFVSIAFFYNLEIGAPLLVAYLLTLVLDFLVKILTKKGLSSVVSNFQTLGISLTALTVLILGLTYLKSGRLPNFFQAFNSISFFSRGFFDIPMPVLGAYYFPLMIYLVSFYLIVFMFIKRNFVNLYSIFFLLSYGILSFFYYIGFSEPHHLLTVIHPSILLFAILFRLFFTYKKQILGLPTFYKTIILTFSFSFLAFLFWPSPKFIKNTLGRFEKRYGKVEESFSKWNYFGTDFYLSDNNGQDFFLAADKIKQYTKGEKKALVLSRFDTLLLIMSQKASFTGFPIAEYQIAFQRDLDQAINKIKKERPRHIFAYSKKHSFSTTDNISLIWQAIQKQYRLVERAGAVDVYKYRSASNDD